MKYFRVWFTDGSAMHIEAKTKKDAIRIAEKHRDPATPIDAVEEL